MTLLEALVTVLLAIVGPGGIIVLVITIRMRARADELARSVGPVNGAGSLQEQMRQVSTSVESLVISDRHTLAQLENLTQATAQNTERITILEAWRHQFGIDEDDRLNPPPTAKEAS